MKLAKGQMLQYRYQPVSKVTIRRDTFYAGKEQNQNYDGGAHVRRWPAWVFFNAGKITGFKTRYNVLYLRELYVKL